ncbi:MAG: A/G-specific adenine glycosylase [Bacteroidales bacterium]
MTEFSYHLIQWYNQNKRDLPWRHTKDPYKIWLSEVILQQTRVIQGLNYYFRFVEKYPGLSSLADATEEEILKLWQGLGYYSRARNLHFAARQIMQDYNGSFPDDYNSLLKIKGIGEYSAAAIASIAYDIPEPVLDGNVYRVVSRYAMIPEPVNSTQGKKKIKTLLYSFIDHNQPGTFNQALMELGARVCIPKNPICGECPLISGCQSFQTNKVALYPVKQKKEKSTDRYFHYVVPIYRQDNEWFTLIRQRNSNDIWKGLYEFPLIESDHLLSKLELESEKTFNSITSGHSFHSLNFSKVIVHKLTHRNIHTCFYTIHLTEMPLLSVNKLFIPTNLNSLFKYPVSRLIEKYLHNNLIFNSLSELNIFF